MPKIVVKFSGSNFRNNQNTNKLQSSVLWTFYFFESQIRI